MIHLLLPQLPALHATELATAHAEAEVARLRGQSCLQHPSQLFSPTGGRRISPAELNEFAAEVRTICEGTVPGRADGPLTRLVHRRLTITRHEAALDGIWAFLACVLLPDIVRWRFGGQKTPADRFLGGGRGLRNVFGRVWWRGELLRDDRAPAGKDPYWLVDELGEDELTGIVERPRAVASRRVALALARALVEVNTKGLPRPDVARETFKAFLRLGYFVEYDALTDDELDVVCQSLYRKSVTTLARSPETPPEEPRP